MNQIDLSIIIVSWNCFEELNNCLTSIYRNTENVNFEVIVIDNASKDFSPNLLKERFPSIHLISLPNNIGFPKANNIGFKVAKGEYFLTLNPDTFVNNKTIEKALAYIKHGDKIGCLGVKTLKETGEIQLHCARKEPTILGSFFQFFYLDKIFKSFKFLNSSDMPYWDHLNSQEVDILHGAFLLFPRKIYKLYGGFDCSIPLYFEDIEFCTRIKKKGYKIFYFADAEIIHFTNQSSNKANPKWIVELRYEALYLYFKKFNNSSINSYLFVALVFISSPIRIFWDPFLSIIYFVAKRRWRFKFFLYDTFVSFLWSIKKILLLR